MSTMHPTLKDDAPYSNCRIYHPDGTLMCCVGRKRIRWYLKRGLAKALNDTDIQLLFVPKGKGKSDVPYCLEHKENRCVICGATKSLTKHHIVPHQYRKHFHDDYKDRNSIDILIICADCHEKYEVLAQKLSRDLMDEYGILDEMKRISKKMKLESSARYAVKRLNDSQHPPNEETVKKLLNKISNYLGVIELSIEDAKNVVIKNKDEKDSIKYISKLLLDKYLEKNSVEDFIIMWREHFLTNTLPKYMSDSWVAGIRTIFY